MYCIEFIAKDNLEIRFGKIISVFVRGKTHCSKKIPDDLRDRCIHLFESMISKIKLVKSDILWSKVESNDRVVYSGLKVQLSTINDDVLNFNHLRHKTNTFMVHFKTKLRLPMATPNL